MSDDGWRIIDETHHHSDEDLREIADVVRASGSMDLDRRVLVEAADPRRERWRNALILHFEAAKSLRVALEECPRWRWRKRRRLRRGVERECHRADLAARFLGAGPDARPLRSILDEAIAARRR